MAEEVVNLNTGADAEVDRKKLKECMSRGIYEGKN